MSPFSVTNIFTKQFDLHYGISRTNRDTNKFHHSTVRQVITHIHHLFSFDITSANPVIKLGHLTCSREVNILNTEKRVSLSDRVTIPTGNNSYRVSKFYCLLNSKAILQIDSSYWFTAGTYRHNFRTQHTIYIKSEFFHPHQIFLEIGHFTRFCEFSQKIGYSEYIFIILSDTRV